jgi:hypothetical protein
VVQDIRLQGFGTRRSGRRGNILHPERSPFSPLTAHLRRGRRGECGRGRQGIGWRD